MKLYEKNKNKKWMNNTIALCAAVLFYLVLSRLGTIFGGIAAFFRFISPVLAGIAFAYIMNPMAVLLQRGPLRGMKQERKQWIVANVITILVVLLVLTLILVAVIPQLVESVLGLINNMGYYAKGLTKMLNDLNAQAASNRIDISKLTEAGENLLGRLTSYVSAHSGELISTVSSVGSNVVTAVISFILAIYFLMDKKHLQAGLKRLLSLLLSDRGYRNLMGFGRRCNAILVRYVWCDLLDGLIIGCSNSVFMMIMQMPYAALVSVVVGVTNLAPTFGPIVGGVVGVFVLMLENPWHALAFLIFTVVLQTIDGYVLKPKMFGGLLGVPGIWILIMIIIGGRMFGVIGILLAIPVAAILDFVYKEYILPALERRKARRTKEEAAGGAENGRPD